MADDFTYHISNASSLAQDIGYLLNDRDAGRGDFADLSTRIRAQLGQLSRQLDNLGSQLRENEAKASLNPRVLAQRKQALQRVQIECNRLKEKEKAVPASAAKEALLAGGTGKTYGGATAIRETEMTRDLSTQEVIDRAHSEMKAQDSVLDDMSKSLDRLQAIGGAIQDESKLHMKLLDDVEQQIDKGQVSLERETRRVELTTKESRTCWLYVTLCILIAVLIALVVVRWH